jgi:uncharacterized protein (TIGR02271 family)
MGEDARSKEVTVPVVEEGLVTGTRAVKTGSVRIRKRVERIRKSIEMPVVKDTAKVERIRVNRVVKTIPQMREENGILIIPVVEEEIVVRRRLVLREEIHVTRKKVEERAAATVSLAKEHAFIERVDAEGRVTTDPQPEESQKLGGAFFKQKGVL